MEKRERMFRLLKISTLGAIKNCSNLNHAGLGYHHGVSRGADQKMAAAAVCFPLLRMTSIRGFAAKNESESDSERVAPSRLTGQKKWNGRKIEESGENRRRFQREASWEKNFLCERRMTLRNARRKMKERGRLIMDDIKEKKNRMKEKLEEVIERENVYTIPNLICITRIGLSPLLGYLIISDHFEFALLFMVVAGISDWIDGWVARNYKSQRSNIGSFLDPVADKVLIGTLFLSLTYVYLIPVALTTLVIGRDVAMIISGFVIRYQSLPPPKTLSRYFDASHATAQLLPTFVSKVNTGVQLVLVGATLGAPVFGYVNHTFLQAMWYVTAISTVSAAASYIFCKKTYKIFKKSKS